MASYLETVIVPDVTMDERIFSLGYPSGKPKTLPDDINYATGKNISAYCEAVAYNPQIIENQFAYYEVESYEELTIGDQVTFQNQEMYVGDVTIALKQGLLIYNATLVKKMTIRQNPIYNSKFQGISLQGKVLDLQNQTVKLHLAIDQEQNPEEAYWYPLVPPTTDMMYLMPQLGTTASLYMPGLKEQEAIITGSIRTNGQSCKNTGDPNIRYMATEYGQELKLAPGGVYITAGRNDLQLSFDDQEGVLLSSHKKMVLEAKEEVVIESEKKVIFSAANQIVMATPQGGLSMENELHMLAPQVCIDCTDDTEFAPVEQPPPEEESGINWCAILIGTAAAVAVCVVAGPAVVAAVAAVGLTGTAATVAGGAVLGAIGGAVAALVETGVEDIQSGEFSGVGKYLGNTLKGALFGLIVGAVLEGAFLGAKALWGVFRSSSVGEHLARYSVRVLDDIADSAIISRVKELRGLLPSSLKRGGNFGLAKVDVPGLKNEFYAHSGIDVLENARSAKDLVADISLKPTNPIFKATTEMTSDGRALLRDIDTEYKILNDIASKIGDNVDVTGKITLFTERAPCSSCEKVISEFSQMFKNINIDIVHNSGTILKP